MCNLERTATGKHARTVTACLHAGLYAALLCMATGAVQANVISRFDTEFDTDFVTSGVGGLRGTGNGDISLSGIDGPVSQAYLYWHGPTDSQDPTNNADLTLNGNPVTGDNIGFSDDNAWGRDNSQAYRADVTSIVSGNGTYSVDGLIPENSNGASIFAFFDDGDPSNNRDVVMFDGNDANFANPYDPLGWDVTLPGIDYASGDARLTLTVSDGQDDPEQPYWNDADLVLNGTTIDSGPEVFLGDSVPQNPNTTVTTGALWDVLNYDITGFLSPGENTLNLTHGTNQDRVSLVNAAIDLPAGAAPGGNGETQVPAPAPAALLVGGLAALWIGSRRRAGRR